MAYLRIHGYKFFHVGNETGSDPAARRRAIRMKQSGVSPGVPDYFVIVKNQLIAIELKRQKGGTLSPQQRTWLSDLAATGMPCFVAKGAAEAIEAVESI